MKSLKTSERCAEARVRCKDLMSVYNAQKSLLGRMERENHEVKHLYHTRMMLLRNNTAAVENILSSIKDTYGTEAEFMMKDIYVNHCRQEDIARAYGYSLRTLQRRCSTWLDLAAEVYNAL